MRMILAAGGLAAVLAACSGGGAAQLLETARFEEVQRNLPHARKLYREIVARYPGTAEAIVATARLSAIGDPEDGQTPAAR